MKLHIHYGVDASAVAFPHTTEAGLTPDVPQLDGNISLGHLLHVETHGWDRSLCKLTRLDTPANEQPANPSSPTHRDDVHQSGLTRVLKTHKGELHLLLPEEGAKEVQHGGDDPLYHGWSHRGRVR